MWGRSGRPGLLYLPGGLRLSAAYGLEPRAVYGDAPGGRVLLYLPGSAEGLRWNTLSEIEKPGSGTEPIHQEHVMCSRFRGSCPSDVKSAVHPESAARISLSNCAAALCPRKANAPFPPPPPPGRESPCFPSASHPLPRDFLDWCMDGGGIKYEFKTDFWTLQV